jgi:hypothetical protein
MPPDPQIISDHDLSLYCIRQDEPCIFALIKSPGLLIILSRLKIRPQKQRIFYEVLGRAANSIYITLLLKIQALRYPGTPRSDESHHLIPFASARGVVHLHLIGTIPLRFLTVRSNSVPDQLMGECSRPLETESCLPMLQDRFVTPPDQKTDKSLSQA